MFRPWAEYLDSEDSRKVLHSGKDGWFSVPALEALQEHFPKKTFFETYISENNPQNFYGFKSFDHFFNRQFQKGVRELTFPEQPNVINAACESKLYNIARNVGEKSEFWLKGEPYSLEHMLAGNFVEKFKGGTVFQGFLQVTGYHRWHSPVTGIIKKVVPIEGTYFAQSPAVLNGDYYGSSPPVPGPDLATNPFLRSLSFVTSLTTRTLIFIESDYANIGLMCFIAIGMTEISTCLLNENVKEGNKITRGDELGMFRFGGSSHALVFGPDAKLTFFDKYDQPGKHVEVRDALAFVPMLPYVQFYLRLIS
jgi:phosphatidylserine decarboxylase